MTNISGIDLIIADSDALIALAYRMDALHERSTRIHKYLEDHEIDTFTPYAIILESATVLSRLYGRPDIAKEILSKYEAMEDKLDLNVVSQVVDLYNPKTSKKNTPFDHYVLALAKKNNIQYVFSFDSFYKKNGLTLMEDVI